ncbi:radical SAM protein [Candidatus Parcubacteria bacterium]|nr:radical SAM protein [Candidatus Parcubacteria bacterium]
MIKLYNIGITNKCNLNCFYCFPEVKTNKQESKAMPAKHYQEKILEAKKNGYDIIHFSNGESALSPYLLELVEFSRIQKLTPSIITNGVLLSDFGYLQKLVKAGLKKIEFTFNCYDKVINEKIVRVADVTKQQLKALKNIGEFNINLTIFTVINSLNYDYLPNHINYLVNNFKFNQIMLLYVIGREGWLHVIPKHSLAEKYIINSLKILKKSKIKFFIGNIPYCFLKEKEFYKNTLEFNGEAPCPVPDIQTIKHDNCVKCKLNFKCRGINLPYYKKYGINEIKDRYFAVN